MKKDSDKGYMLRILMVFFLILAAISIILPRLYLHNIPNEVVVEKTPAVVVKESENNVMPKSIEFMTTTTVDNKNKEVVAQKKNLKVDENLTADSVEQPLDSQPSLAADQGSKESTKDRKSEQDRLEELRRARKEKALTIRAGIIAAQKAAGADQQNAPVLSAEDNPTTHSAQMIERAKAHEVFVR